MPSLIDDSDDEEVNTPKLINTETILELLESSLKSTEDAVESIENTLKTIDDDKAHINEITIKKIVQLVEDVDSTINSVENAFEADKKLEEEVKNIIEKL